MHSLFLEYFLLTASNFAAPDPFDFCDPFKLAGEEGEEEKKASVSIDEWVEVENPRYPIPSNLTYRWRFHHPLKVWGETVGRARKMDDLPMWLQYYPKTLFDTINRR